MMGMQKGICMKLKEDRSIFLMKNGQFVKGQPAGSAAVGEESYFYPVSKRREARIWNPLWVQAIAAIAVLVIFLSVVIPTDEAFAYVQVEINPGLEIGVTEEGNVMSLRPLNEDGTLVIEGLGGWKDQPLNSILTAIFKDCIEDDTKDITITTVAAKKGKIGAIDKMVMAVSTEIANERITVQLKRASREDWRRSVKERVPAGDLVEKSTPVKKAKVPAVELETPIVPKENPIREEKVSVPVQEEKPQNPGKEPADTPAHPNNKKTVPGQDKKQQPPANGVKEEPAKTKPEPNAKPKPKAKAEPKAKPKPKVEPAPKAKPQPKSEPKPKPEKKSNNKNDIPGQDKKNKNVAPKEKPGNNGQGNNKKEPPLSHKDRVPGQDKKPDKEGGKANSSPGKGGPGPKDNGPGKSGSPGQQKKNKDGKE